MMRPRARLLEIAERRARYVERARVERERVAAFAAKADRALAWVDTGRRMLQELARRPLVIAAAVALLFALRPRRTLKWLATGWSLWRLYRQASRLWQRLDAVVGAPPARRAG
jgi:hypothetical protein